MISSYLGACSSVFDLHQIKAPLTHNHPSPKHSLPAAHWIPLEASAICFFSERSFLLDPGSSRSELNPSAGGRTCPSNQLHMPGQQSKTLSKANGNFPSGPFGFKTDIPWYLWGFCEIARLLLTPFSFTLHTPGVLHGVITICKYVVTATAEWYPTESQTSKNLTVVLIHHLHWIWHHETSGSSSKSKESWKVNTWNWFRTSRQSHEEGLS